MSAKWMGYFFDDTDLKGSELLLALAIADHADADGFCYPKIERLAAKIRLKVRQTQAILKTLSEKGFVEVDNRGGRGIPTFYQLKRVHPTAPFTGTKGCSLATQKGAVWQHKRVQSGDIPLYKDKPSFKPSFKPSEKESEFQNKKNDGDAGKTASANDPPPKPNAPGTKTHRAAAREIIAYLCFGFPPDKLKYLSAKQETKIQSAIRDIEILSDNKVFPALNYFGSFWANDWRSADKKFNKFQRPRPEQFGELWFEFIESDALTKKQAAADGGGREKPDYSDFDEMEF